jgi:hypothetical protein
MNRRKLAPGIVLLSSVGLLGCDGLTGSTAPPGSSDSGSNVVPSEDEGVGSNGRAPSVPGTPVAVGEVTLEVASRTIDAGAESGSRVSARVINDSDRTIEVTLRFLFDDRIVHLAYLQVIPHTITTIVSPDRADEVRVSGVDDGGDAIPRATFLAGVDFTDDTPAIFRMLPIIPPEENDPDDEVIGVDPPEPSPDPYSPPQIVALAPESDISLPLGSTIDIRWTDESAVDGAVVLVGLRPESAGGDAAFVQLAPAVGEPLDGINDEIRVVLQGIEPGVYDLLTIIDDGVMRVESVAPGSVTLRLAPDNDAPTIEIALPASAIELQGGESFRVAWDDDDADDNATVTISLEPGADADPGAPSYVISPPMAEDPDGPGADEALLVIDGVLPGRYDLVGVIDDGSLVGVSRRAGLIKVLPDAVNDVPRLTFAQPVGDVPVDAGGSILVAWADEDDNDNAMISLMLDPDQSGGELDGDEIVLITALAEDPDGSGDMVRLGIPETLPPGPYRMGGVITDGVSRMVTFAQATVYVRPGDVDPPPVRHLRILGGGREDVFINLGDPIKVEANIENIFDARYFLSNLDFGGSIRVELIPRPSGENGDPGNLTFKLPTADAAIPNEAWPRKFVLEMVTDIGLGDERATASRPVWVFQDVQVLDIDLSHLACSGEASSDESPPENTNGITLTWFGGDFCEPFEGLDEERPSPDVFCPPSHESLGLDFWLTADGEIPEEGRCTGEDHCPRHRLLLTSESSPNQVRSDHIPVPVVQWMEDGSYQMVAVDQSGRRTPILHSSAGPLILELCFPAE